MFEMNCRIARAYGVTPEIPWHWPFTWWRKVRDELVDSWKPPPKDDNDDF